MNEEQIKSDIRQQYKCGVSVSKLIENFGRGVVNRALHGYRRNRSEANRLAHKLYPDSFKLSEDTKKKISEARKKYLKENPEKVPYKINHSSKKSWPEEIFERALIRYNIKDWVRNYRNGLYEYDFAFPLQKIDIEIDGFTHTLTKVQLIDKKRDQWSQSQGWKVIRFKAKHILRDINQCMELLQDYLKNTEINIADIINKEFLMLRTKKDRRKFEKQQKKLNCKRILC